MPSSDTQFKEGNEGRPKGSLNRTTRLKNDILDGIEVAAKRADMTRAEYVATMMESRNDRLGVLRIGAGLIPKELSIDAKVQRVVINVRPDEDCGKESE